MATAVTTPRRGRSDAPNEGSVALICSSSSVCIAHPLALGVPSRVAFRGPTRRSVRAQRLGRGGLWSSWTGDVRPAEVVPLLSGVAGQRSSGAASFLSGYDEHDAALRHPARDPSLPRSD